MPTRSSTSAQLTPSQRKKRWRERNGHLSKERVVLLPTDANDALLKLAAITDLSPSVILLSGLYGVASLSTEHLRELAIEAATHYGRSLSEKPKPPESSTAGQAQGQRQ